MRDNALGRALLACEAPLGDDPRQMIGRVLERDRMRVRTLTWATVALWLVAAGGVLVLAWCFVQYLEPKLWVHAQAQQTEGTRNVAGYWVMIGNVAALSVGVLAATLLAAAVSTVWLVQASRRATMRQVNSQLAQICDELQQIRQALEKSAGP